jgi:4'-phosphopantetheinyl transferase
MPMPLGAHDVHVRFRPIDTFDEDEAAAAIDTLSVEERERAARFVLGRDRLMFIAAHAMLRAALSDYEQVPPGTWEFDRIGNGKPVLAARHRDIALTFNLAHTRGLVACAISRGADVGVDVEPVKSRPHALDIATRFFSPAEVEQLSACTGTDRDVRFIEIWTLKESYIKALGEGLAHPLGGFGFSFDEGPSFRFEPARGGDAAGWQFELFAPTPGHRLAVAVRSGPTPYTITSWSSHDAARTAIAPLRRMAYC